MTLRVGFHPDAVRELAEAIRRYDRGGQGRGTRFRADFNRVVDRCLEWPKSGEVVPDTGGKRVFRHAKVPRSHYRVVYHVTGDILTVVAIAHERRLPLYWTGRE